MEGTSNLDAIDFAILEALQKNARLSNKGLATEWGSRSRAAWRG